MPVQRKGLGKRIFRLFVIRGLGVAALLGLEVTLARWLGVAGFGAFNITLAFAMIVARLAPMGWPHASTKYISNYVHGGQPALVKGVVIQSHVTTVIGLAGAMALIVAGQMAWPAVFGQFSFITAIPLMVALAFLELHRIMLRGFHLGDLGEALSTLALPLAIIAMVWMLAVTSPDRVVTLYSAACVVLLGISAAAIWRSMPASSRAMPAEYKTREWSFAAIALLLGTISDELSARTSIIILGAAADSEAVGLYQAGARMALMNVFVLRIITPAAAPHISVLYHAGNMAELRKTYGRMCAMSLAGALVFSAIFWIAGDRILSLFGAEFTKAYGVLAILSVGYLASAAAGPCATSLMMIGKERTYAILAAVFFAIEAGLCFVLASRYGAMGAAAATAAALVIANASYLICFLRATRPAIRAGS